MITGVTKPKVLFFPNNIPTYVNVFIKLPEGTGQHVTDSVTTLVEKKVNTVLGEKNPIVESIITNVGFNAGDGMFDRSVSSNKGKVTINFIESKFRHGVSTQDYMDKIRENLKNIPGVTISVEKNRSGPPTGKPINIEITGENLDDLITASGSFKAYLDSLRIPGIEQLKSDFENNKPEIIVDIDRVRANREGLSLGQIGLEMRTGIFGKEISKYKEGEDEYPIQLRYSESARNNVNQVINAKITYRDMNSGQLRQIPISSVATIKYKD
ncbi:MAG: efflux RND transporter permease subunit, partial [Spirochaetota bacterium]